MLLDCIKQKHNFSYLKTLQTGHVKYIYILITPKFYPHVCYIPRTIIPCEENKTRATKPKQAQRHARNNHSRVPPPPCLSIKTPKIGPPAAPPISNKVDKSPALRGGYPSESLRYSGSQRYRAEIAGGRNQKIYYSLKMEKNINTSLCIYIKFSTTFPYRNEQI